MTRRLLVTAAFAALSLQFASAQALSPAETKQVIREVQTSLGMLRTANRVDAISTQEMWATGTARMGGQNGAAPANVNITAYHAWFDYNLPGMRVDETFTNGGAPQHQGMAVSGKYAWNESEPGAGLVPGKGTVTPMKDADQPRLLRLETMPFPLIKAAVKNGDKTQAIKENGATVLVIPLDVVGLPGVTARATLDKDNRIGKVETKSATANLNIETTYTGYKDLDDPLLQTDVMFPQHITVRQGGNTVLDLTVSKVDANNPYLIVPVPPDVEKAGG